MHHPAIDDEHMLDHYLAGHLDAEDEARFEEHLFECALCFEQVQAGEELRRGLQAVAAEDAARATVAAGLMAWLRSRGRGQLAGLATLALAFVLLPALLLWQQAEVHRLRSIARQAPGQGILTQPSGDFVVVSLGVVRDAESAAEIRPEPGRDAFLLSLELPVVNAARYRVTLEKASGEVLWRGDDLEPNLYDSLLVALPSSFLAPGSYRITIEGLTAEGFAPAGEIGFRVLPARE